MEVAQMIENLFDRDDKLAYQNLLELEALSEGSDQVYPYFDRLVQLMDDPSSYRRARGLRLLAVNCRWDTQGRFDSVLERYLAHCLDEKPIVSRQCIQYLLKLLPYKRGLAPRIRDALTQLDSSRYPESMSGLVDRDVQKVLGWIDQNRADEGTSL